MHSVDASDVDAFTQRVCMSPTLNGSSEIQHFECSDAIEISIGLIFDFYTGLPHVLVKVTRKFQTHGLLGILVKLCA